MRDKIKKYIKKFKKDSTSCKCHRCPLDHATFISWFPNYYDELTEADKMLGSCVKRLVFIFHFFHASKEIQSIIDDSENYFSCLKTANSLIDFFNKKMEIEIE